MERVRLNWKQATRKQLYDIAFNDQECPRKYRLDALAELHRREIKPKLSGKLIERQYAKR
jgi:hypothetical protein